MGIPRRSKLLIMVTVLGVLAVVIISSGSRLLVKGEEQARRAEYHVVSSAVIAMMADNNLSTIPNPRDFAGGVGVNDMTAFPDNTSVAGSADKQTDPQGYDYEGTTDKDGYILYGHDIMLMLLKQTLLIIC